MSPMMHWTSLYRPPGYGTLLDRGPPVSDIWWSSLETGLNLFPENCRTVVPEDCVVVKNVSPSQLFCMNSSLERLEENKLRITCSIELPGKTINIKDTAGTFRDR